MADIEIKTTHGYTATIRPYFTYDEFIELQKILCKTSSDRHGDVAKTINLRRR